MAEVMALVCPGAAVRLLTVQRGSAVLLQVTTGQVEFIQALQSDPVAWSFDVARGRFYWADGRGNIYRSDGQHNTTLHTGEFRRPRLKGLDLFCGG